MLLLFVIALISMQVCQRVYLCFELFYLTRAIDDALLAEEFIKRDTLIFVVGLKADLPNCEHKVSASTARFYNNPISLTFARQAFGSKWLCELSSKDTKKVDTLILHIACNLLPLAPPLKDLHQEVFKNTEVIMGKRVSPCVLS